MDRGETRTCPGTDQNASGGTRTLMRIAGTVQGEPDVALGHIAPCRQAGGRPMAPFVTQLIVSVDASLRPTRLERTREAAALYTRAGQGPGRRSA